MIYLDNHSTTRVDPRVVAAMNQMLDIDYANAGSISHQAGREVANKVQNAINVLGDCLDVDADELVITSGATESNNLALFGVCLHPRQKRRKIVSAVSEHRAILDPLERLKSHGFEIVMLPVFPQGRSNVGQINLDQAAQAIDENTALVTIMHSNNEIGSYQPIRELAEICERSGALLHTDATQTIGHEPLSIRELGCHLLSFSAHKFYGPKGIGGLFVASNSSPIRLQPQILGGGQQLNRRSGTLNSASIIGMSEALRLCMETIANSVDHDRQMRDRLWRGLQEIRYSRIRLNGPATDGHARLARNLNVEFPGFEGQTLMLKCSSLCVSSGSACTSADPHPSHVLQAIGLATDQARCSIRFGVGRFTTIEEIETGVELISEALETHI